MIAVSGEPYESAFVVRGLIRDQIAEAANLKFDEKTGEAKAPLLFWGPYLWSDGVTPRASDHLVWPRNDLAETAIIPEQRT